jgi:hypothetical protein
MTEKKLDHRVIGVFLARHGIAFLGILKTFTEQKKHQ